MQMNPQTDTCNQSKIFLVVIHEHTLSKPGRHSCSDVFTPSRSRITSNELFLPTWKCFTDFAVGFLSSHKVLERLEMHFKHVFSPEDHLRIILAAYCLNRSPHSDKGRRNDSCCLIMKTATPLTSCQSKSTTGCFSSGPSHV